MTQEELERNLAHFTGTEEYTRAKYPGINLLLTDGAKYLCDNAKCYWLMGSTVPFSKGFQRSTWQKAP